MTFRSFLLGVALSLGCARPTDGGNDAGLPDSTDGGVQVVAVRTLVAGRAGRVAWHHATNLIAFDHPANLAATSLDVSTISPDGSGRRCVTCEVQGLPTGLRGQPAWHPSGEFLVIQAPNASNIAQSGVSASSPFHGPGWGINQDLWLVAADATWAERILVTPQNGAALHPQFSESGDQLFLAVREATGVNLGLATPGGENPWDGWHLEVVPFARTAEGTILGARQPLFRGTGSFFESHHLSGDRIWFSRTQGGKPFVDDGFVGDLDGGALLNVTEAPAAWDEHLAPSPGGTLVTFNSSRGFAFDATAGDGFPQLQMEIWAVRADGRRRQRRRSG